MTMRQMGSGLNQNEINIRSDRRRTNFTAAKRLVLMAAWGVLLGLAPAPRCQAAAIILDQAVGEFNASTSAAWHYVDEEGFTVDEWIYGGSSAAIAGASAHASGGHVFPPAGVYSTLSPPVGIGFMNASLDVGAGSNDPWQRFSAGANIFGSIAVPAYYDDNTGSTDFKLLYGYISTGNTVLSIDIPGSGKQYFGSGSGSGIRYSEPGYEGHASFAAELGAAYAENHDFLVFSYLWVAGPAGGGLPGKTPQWPIAAVTPGTLDPESDDAGGGDDDDDDDDDKPGVPPAEVSGAFLTAPSAEFSTPIIAEAGFGKGEDGMLFFDPAWSASYLYTIAHNRATELLIPSALPGGDTEFAVRFGENGEHTYPVTAGVVFDFDAYVPEGVSWFVLSGLDLDVVPDPLADPPFVTGLTFAEDGVAHLRIRAEAALVPEPASATLLCAGGLFALACASIRKRDRRC